MRTSATQIQLLVEFMESNGDLSKPAEGPQGRAANMRHWINLRDTLNADATGDTKTVEKWRKEDVPLPVQTITEQDSPSIFLLQQQIGQQTCSNIEEDYNLPGPSTRNTQTGWETFSNLELPVLERAEARPMQGEPEPSVTRPVTSSARQQQIPTSPTPLPPTPRRRRRPQPSAASPFQRRTRTQTQSDLARQAFVRSDCDWRAFQKETERERIRLREEELKMQGRWLELFNNFLVLGNRVVDYLEKK